MNAIARNGLIGLLVMGLCAAAPARGAGEGNSAVTPDLTLRYPVVVVPYLAKPPVMDGKVEREEWLGAAQPVPMVAADTGEATDEPAQYWLSYSDKGFHLAFRFGRPAYAPTPASQSGASLFKGDCIEVYILPPERKGDYVFAVNARGEGDAGLRTQSTRRGYPTQWTFGGRTVDNAWEGEMTIPFASMDQALPKPGTVWRISVVRNRRTPVSGLAYGSYQKDWRAAGDYGYICFGDKTTPAVRVSDAGALTPSDVGGDIELVGNSVARKVKVHAELYAPKEAVTKEVEWLTGGDTVLKAQVAMSYFEIIETMTRQAALAKYSEVGQLDETIDLPANAAKRVSLIKKEPVGKYVFHFVATDADSGAVLGGGALPFRQEPACKVSVKPYLLSAHAIGVDVNYARVEGVTKGSAVKAELLKAGDAKPVDSVSEPAELQKRKTVLKLPVRELFEQSYVVRTTLSDEKGKVIVQDNQTLNTPKRPVWYENDIGKVDMVLPPWTPIQTEGRDVARVVLRQYTMGENALPKAIVSRDKPLLAGPIALTLGDATLRWTMKQTAATPTHVVWEADAAEAGLALKLTTTLEYDGMMRCDLTLTPQGRPYTMKNLVLTIPYRKDRALFGAVGAKGSAMTAFRNWTAINEFRPLAWVGDYDTGLYWVAEWARDWQIGALPVFEKKIQGDELLWLVRMIGQEGKTLDAPLTLTFGLMAVPARDIEQAIRYAADQKRYVKMAVPQPGPEITNSYLRYPTQGNLPPEEGSLCFRTIATIVRDTDEFQSTDTSHILQIGEKSDALTLYLTRAWEHQDKTALALVKGSFATLERQKSKGNNFTVLAKIQNIQCDNNSWMDIGLSWKKEAEKVRLELSYRDPQGAAKCVAGALTWDEWRKCLASPELRFGGVNFLGVDQVMVCKHALGATALLALDDKLPTAMDEFTLVDSLDHFRLSRGMLMSRPEKITQGMGGIAGGQYDGTGMFTRKIEGYSGTGLLLPGGPLTLRECMESFRIKVLCPIQEQFHVVTSTEGFESVRDPILQRYYRKLQLDGGVDTIMYSGLCFHPNSIYLRDFFNDIADEPLSAVSEGAFSQRKGSSLYADFHIWAWKQNADYYGLNGIQMDNTLSVELDKSLIRGTGYYDQNGKLQGRFPVFEAREHAKRIRWLFHVYKKDGLVKLHAGGRDWPMVADFVDMFEFGEGWLIGEKFKLEVPESDSWAGSTNGGQYRLGYPGQVRNKPGVYEFGPNYFYLYCLLFNMNVRGLGQGYNVHSWYIDEKAPSRHNKGDASIHGVFSPYYVKAGVKTVADPQALWRQLRDDFDIASARFVGFWDAAPWMQCSDPLIRTSFHLHQGRDALFVVANFNDKAAETGLNVDFARMGLDPVHLRVFDAWTDEQYPLDGQTIRLQVPSYQYRLLRVENRP